MKIVLVFISPNNTTKEVTKLLYENLRRYNHEIEVIDIGLKINRENAKILINKILDFDIVGFGSPVYHMNIIHPMQSILLQICANRKYGNKNIKSFIFLTYAGITSGKAFHNYYKCMKQSNISIVGGIKIQAPHFHHQHLFPNEETELVISDFIDSLEKNNYQSIKWKNVKRLFKPLKIIIIILYPLINIIGKIRELPISITNSKCKKCSKCIIECPVGAIKIRDDILMQDKNCIHCYHCTIACKYGAIECPTEKLKKMISLNKKIVGMENPVNNFYI